MDALQEERASWSSSHRLTDIFVTLMHWSSHQSAVVRLCLTLCVLTETFPCHTGDVTVTMFGTFELDCKYVIFTLTVETTFCWLGLFFPFLQLWFF